MRSSTSATFLLAASLHEFVGIVGAAPWGPWHGPPTTASISPPFSTPVSWPPFQTDQPSDYYVSLGPRPFYIVDNMTDSPLKTKLESCENGPFSITGFSIGHRGGGTLQFPEETVQNANAGARMGAGILECDVAFTYDLGLVCRHSLCDLHTTTNILTIPELAAKCTTPFTPANDTAPASALCCTSDITTAEYLSLCGKQDGFNASAETPADYQYGTPTWRTELYDSCGTVQTLESYIDLVNSYPGNRNFTPELKTPPADVPMPFRGFYTQENYAQQFVDTFRNKSIDFSRIWPQSFTPDDIFYWLKNEPVFGRQAIYLDERNLNATDYAIGVASLPGLKALGVNIVGPEFGMLLRVGGADNATIVPSEYAIAARAAGLDMIPWTFERSGPLATVDVRVEGYYNDYPGIASVITEDGQLYEVLDVLANEVGIKGIFSDWSSTITYFANCFGLTGLDSADYV